MSSSSNGGTFRPLRVTRGISSLLLLFSLLVTGVVLGVFVSSASALPNATSKASWVDRETIRLGDTDFTLREGSKWIFEFSQTTSTLTGTSVECVSTLTFNDNPYNGDNGETALRTLKLPGDTGGCTTVGGTNKSIAVANADNAQAAALAEGADRCDAKFYNPLSWFICPVVDMAFGFIEHMDNAINTLMTVDTGSIFNSDNEREDRKTSSAYYEAWSAFRFIALGIVVIATLVVIVASAFGYELLDAYTIRKALPRVLLAVILISLSWQIMEFLITLTNDVGNGVRALIYAPFADFERAQIRFGEQSLFTLLFGAGMIAMGIGGLLSFIATAFLAVLVAFLVLVIREMIIITLVILAPIAFALLILPNTQKGWQFWQNTLTAMLVAFPIIAAFIAVGRVFSAVAFQNGEAGTLNSIIAFLAYFLPYFLLPLTFRMAGGILATIGNIANSSERGAFDRLKKYRQGKVAQNTQAMKEGKRFQEHGGKWIGMPTRGFNKTTQGVAVGWKGRYGVGARGQEARDIANRNSMADIQKSPGWNAIQEDDDTLRALTYSSASEANKGLFERNIEDARTKLADGKITQAEFSAAEIEARTSANRAVKAAQSSIGFGRPQAIAAAQQLGVTGTGYRDQDDMAETVARAAGGNTSSGAAMGGFLNFVNKQKGRHDLAPGATNLIKSVHAKMGESVPDLKPPKEQMHEAWNSGSLYQIANGKNAAMKNFAKHHLEMLNSSDLNDKRKAAIALAEMQNMLPSASGANQEVIVDTMRQAGIDYNDRSMSIEEQIVRATAQHGLPSGHSGPVQPVITAADLRGSARVYDREEMRTRQASGDA